MFTVLNTTETKYYYQYSLYLHYLQYWLYWQYHPYDARTTNNYNGYTTYNSNTSHTHTPPHKHTHTQKKKKKINCNNVLYLLLSCSWFFSSPFFRHLVEGLTRKTKKMIEPLKAGLDKGKQTTPKTGHSGANRQAVKINRPWKGLWGVY